MKGDGKREEGTEKEIDKTSLERGRETDDRDKVQEGVKQIKQTGE